MNTNSPQRHRVPASARSLIGDNVLSPLRPASDWRRRFALMAQRPVSPLGAIHAVEDLVERVLGASPLPRDDRDVTLLLVGLRRQLPRLEEILRGTAPTLVSQARRIREEPVPSDHMGLVILTIRLAEIATELIHAASVEGAPRRADVQAALVDEGPDRGDQGVAALGLIEDAPITLAPLQTSVPDVTGRDVSHVRASPAAELVSTAAGSLGDCGPPS